MPHWIAPTLATVADTATTTVLTVALTAASPSPTVIANGSQEGVSPAKVGRWIDRGGTPRTIEIGHDPASGNGGWMSTGGLLIDAMRALELSAIRLPPAAKIGAEAWNGLATGALLHGFRLAQGRAAARAEEAVLTLVLDPADQALADRVTQATTPINRARAWVEQPANLLTPHVFAQEATEALTAAGATTRTLDRAALQALGAGGLLAVGRASSNPECLFVAEWRGARERDGWDAVLVGKGVTFDAGGLNLKVRPVIEKMKFDMGGGAAVLGAFEAAVTRRAKANLAVVVPMTENMIGSDGYRPGDVIRMLSGQTVEVINTDAEGRIVLADGITYAIREYDPRHLVDVATLTGMITGVLHEEFAGLYASDDTLAAALTAAGEGCGEALWRMPLSKRQDYLVDSPVADVANMGAGGLLGLGMGSPAAGAKFIERFTGGRSWAHIDIAGTAWASRRTDRTGAGATGFGVALLDAWIGALEHPLRPE